MKLFSVQAICDQKALWEIMCLLEHNKCTGILARPLTNSGAEIPQKKKRGRRPNGEVTFKEIALDILRNASEPITPAELRQYMHEKGHLVGKVNAMLFQLKKAGKVRCPAPGQYVIKKGT